VYSNYLFTDSTITAMTGAAYPSTLGSFPYTPRLDMGWYASPLRTTTGFPAIGPAFAPAMSTPVATASKPIISGEPRIRQAMYPAVAVSPGSDLLRQKLGPAGSKGEAPASIEVVVPNADAKIWFQGQETRRSGKVREFESPRLASGSSYAYEVRAQWMDGDQPVTQTRTVPVRAGERVRVDFTTK